MQSDKVTLRNRILAQRDALSDESRAAMSVRIAERMIAVPAIAAARCVLAYLSFGSEFQSDALLAALNARGTRIVLPKVERKARRLRLFHVHDIAAETAAGIWGIREPREDRCLEARLEDIDVVVVPGVAFTRRGERLGYGGGFYDRLLGNWTPRPPCIAPAFAMQVVDTLPVDAHDIPVDLVVTESDSLARPA